MYPLIAIRYAFSRKGSMAMMDWADCVARAYSLALSDPSASISRALIRMRVASARTWSAHDPVMPSKGADVISANAFRALCRTA
ncbi:hypothetical protein C7458_105389 [Williamsia muralis]|nr:hypothetical protein C7458_105389 [Williamsia marianensis]